MLGRLLKRRGAREPQAGPQICMVALASDQPPPAGAVFEAWRELFPDVPIRADESKEGQAPGVYVGDVPLALMPMPMPIPQNDIESAVPRSWMWPEAAQEMARQRSHMTIVGVTSESPIDDAMAVSRFAAAVCRAGQPAGVYWGSGGHVIEPGMFVDSVMKLEPPVPLWVGVVVSRGTTVDTFAVSTCGMQALGHREFEIIDTRMQPGDLAGTMYDLAAYVLTNGPVLEHGHTFGPTPEDKWRVEHTTSVFRKGEPVLRLHVP